MGNSRIDRIHSKIVRLSLASSAFSISSWPYFLGSTSAPPPIINPSSSSLTVGLPGVMRFGMPPAKRIESAVKNHAEPPPSSGPVTPITGLFLRILLNPPVHQFNPFSIEPDHCLFFYFLIGSHIPVKLILILCQFFYNHPTVPFQSQCPAFIFNGAVRQPVVPCWPSRR